MQTLQRLRRAPCHSTAAAAPTAAAAIVARHRWRVVLAGTSRDRLPGGHTARSPHRMPLPPRGGMSYSMSCSRLRRAGTRMFHAESGSRCLRTRAARWNAVQHSALQRAVQHDAHRRGALRATDGARVRRRRGHSRGADAKQRNALALCAARLGAGWGSRVQGICLPTYLHASRRSWPIQSCDGAKMIVAPADRACGAKRTEINERETYEPNPSSTEHHGGVMRCLRAQSAC